MSNLNISVPDLAELKPRITVFGVGGGGCNAVNNMIESNLCGVEFVVANTDAQALAKSLCERRIQMGNALTQGLGAGSQPEIGAGAAEETLGEIADHLAGSHMAFITAGMGGGTGTGAAPVIARAAKEQGILTVGVVTKPFNFEGKRRMTIAERGIENLAQFVDTLIVIPNQNLFRVANEKTSFTAAFAMADQVLYSGVASITELMTEEGLINLDFADVRAVMAEMGKAMMGTGEASGETRAVEAAEAAISNPLLDDVSLTGARGVLVSIAGGPDLTLYEVDEAANAIRKEVDEEANIIVGATIKDELEGTMRVSVVATGLSEEAVSKSPQQVGGQSDELVKSYSPGMTPTSPYGAPPVGVMQKKAEPEEAAAEETATDGGREAPRESVSGEQQAEMTFPPRTPEPVAEEEPVEAEAGNDPVMDEQESGSAPLMREPSPVRREPVHEPAPPAARVPEIDEFPEPIKTNAARKAEQIAAVTSKPASRRSLLERLKMLGRGAMDKSMGGGEQGAKVEPPARNVHKLEDARAGQAEAQPRPPEPAPESLDAGHDEMSIPAFLRKQQN